MATSTNQRTDDLTSMIGSELKFPIDRRRERTREEPGTMTEATGTENAQERCAFCGEAHETPVAFGGLVSLGDLFASRGAGAAPERRSETDERIRMDEALTEAFGADEAQAYRPMFDSLGDYERTEERGNRKHVDADEAGQPDINTEELQLANIAMMLVAMSYSRVANDSAPGIIGVMLKIGQQQRQEYVGELWRKLIERNGVDPNDPSAVGELVAQVGMRFSEVINRATQGKMSGVIVAPF